MEPKAPPLLAETMLLLGRLDGRLQHSPVADIFLARAQLEGAVALAGLAGVPIRMRDLTDWIAGRSPPPRASEGLNDPISVAALFHLALGRDTDSSDRLLRATLNTLRTILDDRAEAETYGTDDLAYFGPMWRMVRQAAHEPGLTADLRSVAQRVFELAEMTQAAPSTSVAVSTVDGRSMNLPGHSRDRVWLLAASVPLLLFRAGLTSQVIPSLVILPKLLPATPSSLAETMHAKLHAEVVAGERELNAIERQAAFRSSTQAVTSRSRAPVLERLLLAYPGLQPRAVARLLGVTPQGARKMIAAVTAKSL